MTPRTRLVATTALFAGWIAWLAYLALTSSHPIVLSRPQFLASTLDVVAEVGEDSGHPAGTATVRRIHWPADRGELANQRITVTNLASCDAQCGWQGSGEYILPLVADGDAFRIATTPVSPGFPGPSITPALSRVRIYRVTPDTQRQLERIAKPVQAAARSRTGANPRQPE